jgi:hypothetical protein
MVSYHQRKKVQVPGIACESYVICPHGLSLCLQPLSQQATYAPATWNSHTSQIVLLLHSPRAQLPLNFHPTKVFFKSQAMF